MDDRSPAKTQTKPKALQVFSFTPPVEHKDTGFGDPPESVFYGAPNKVDRTWRECATIQPHGIVTWLPHLGKLNTSQWSTQSLKVVHYRQNHKQRAVRFYGEGCAPWKQTLWQKRRLHAARLCTNNSEATVQITYLDGGVRSVLGRAMLSRHAACRPTLALVAEAQSTWPRLLRYLHPGLLMETSKTQREDSSITARVKTIIQIQFSYLTS